MPHKATKVDFHGKSVAFERKLQPAWKPDSGRQLMKTNILNAYISLGSNLGDRAGNLLLAVRGIMDSNLDVVQLSHIYETVPIETGPQPNFLNMVAELRGSTLPSPESLMARLLRVEYSLGRTRDIPKGPRTIDLDLLLYQNEKRDTELLKLPHPRLPFRRFVLIPLAELSPQLLHPVLHKTISELLEETTDRSAVHRWTPARTARQ